MHYKFNLVHNTQQVSLYKTLHSVNRIPVVVGMLDFIHLVQMSLSALCKYNTGWVKPSFVIFDIRAL